MQGINRFLARFGSVAVTLVLLGLSLLPLSALLLAYPAIQPQETVLTDDAPERKSFLSRWKGRLGALLSAFFVLIFLTAAATETVTRLPLPSKGHYAFPFVKFLDAGDQGLAKIKLHDPDAKPLSELLPPAMVQHWPFVILFIYLGDLVLLFFLGKVPIAYNLRNVLVRWKTSSLTFLSFGLVLFILTLMLGFVNGMNDVVENTGIPGNVFILSEGATDEVFSNLGYGDIDNVENVAVELDTEDQPLDRPIRIRRISSENRQKAAVSRETYYVLNQPIAGSQPPRRRFVQIRTLEDADLGAFVHKTELFPGSRWFTRVGVDDLSRVECVLGEGIAGTLGQDAGKPQLQPGDTFQLGDMEWLVVGIMKSEGTTYGSEIWAQRFPRIYKAFGKDKFTTMVVRVDDDAGESARSFAHHLTRRYTQQKLKAFSEPDYYAEKAKSINTMLFLIIMLALVMALGGVFGMMTTMFASISQRIRDIGVLRLLGFKRWQVLTSFMIESFTTALIGGAIGIAIGYLAWHGLKTTSVMGGGGGPSQSYVIRTNVDVEVIAVEFLMTFAMGRLGGLVPALSAIRVKILDSLR